MKLRYFCDGCGKEVPRNSKRCPSCGKFFAAVQCPSCGYQGEAGDFDAGCPRCGYLKLPESRLPKLNRIGLKTSSGGPASPPAALFRVLGIVLALMLVGFLLILFLRGGFR
jgi:hypothetical protein